MQHDHIMKRFKFDLGPTPLVHPRGSESGLQTEIPFDDDDDDELEFNDASTLLGH